MAISKGARCAVRFGDSNAAILDVGQGDHSLIGVQDQLVASLVRVVFAGGQVNAVILLGCAGDACVDRQPFVGAVFVTALVKRTVRILLKAAVDGLGIELVQADLQLCVAEADALIQGEIEDDALFETDAVEIDLVVGAYCQVVVDGSDGVALEGSGSFSVGIEGAVAVFGEGACAGTDGDAGRVDGGNTGTVAYDHGAQLLKSRIFLVGQVEIFQSIAVFVIQLCDRTVDANAVQIEAGSCASETGNALDLHIILVRLQTADTNHRYLIDALVVGVVFAIGVVVVFQDNGDAAEDGVLGVAVIILFRIAVLIQHRLLDLDDKNGIVGGVGSADQLKARAAEGEVRNNGVVHDLDDVGGVAALGDTAALVGGVVAVLLAVVDALGQIRAAGAVGGDGFHRDGAAVFVLYLHGFPIPAVMDGRKVVLIVDDAGRNDGGFVPHLHLFMDIQCTDFLCVRLGALRNADGGVEAVCAVHKFVRRIGEARAVVGRRKLAVLRFHLCGGVRVKDYAVFICGRVEAGCAFGLIAFIAEGRGSAGNFEVIVFRICLAEFRFQSVVKYDGIGGRIKHIGLQRYNNLRRAVGNLDKTGVGADCVVIDIHYGGLTAAGYADRAVRELRTAGGADGERRKVIHSQTGDLAVKGVVCVFGGIQHILHECFAGDVQLLRFPLVVHGVVRRVELEGVAAGDLGIRPIIRNTDRIQLVFEAVICHSLADVLEIDAADQDGLSGGKMDAAFSEDGLQGGILQAVVDGNGVAVLVENRDPKVRSGEGFAFLVDDLALAGGEEGQPVGVVDADAETGILKFKALQIFRSRVSDGEAVFHKARGIDGGAGLEFAALISVLFRLCAVGGDFEIREDAHIRAVAVALHVEEVEVVALAVLQGQLSVALGDVGSAGDLLIGGVDIVVKAHFDLCDAVGTADVQNQLTVDEEVNVVVAFKVEEQVLVRVIDETAAGFEHIVIVSVVVFRTTVYDARIKVIALGLSVAVVLRGDRQEGIIGSAEAIDIIVHCLARCGGVADGLGGAVVLHCCGCQIGVGRGGKACIEHIAVLACLGGGSCQNKAVIGSHIVAEVRRIHVIALRIKDAVKQVISRVKAGSDIRFRC